MKLPGPDHPITIAPETKRIRILAGTQVIAETTQALALREAHYPTVRYIPRSDVRMEMLQKTERSTHCPYKGDASYFSIEADGRRFENAVWSYEAPFPAVQEIAELLAFYPDKVTIDVAS